MLQTTEGDAEQTSMAHSVDETLLSSSVSSSNSEATFVSAPSLTTSSTFILPSAPNSPHSHHSRSRSPSIGSVSESSLPSVSSSFFFSSSAVASPGRSHPGSNPRSEPGHEDIHNHNSEQELIIPSLTLPKALRRPTPFGQTLGELRILVLGGQGEGKSFLTGLLFEDNEDIVDVGTWEDWNGGDLESMARPDAAGVNFSFSYGKVLRASTDWVDQHEQDEFGHERFEPSKNVEIVELPGYSLTPDSDVKDIISHLKSIIESPFHVTHSVLNPSTQPSGVLARLLAAPTTPLYTALVFLLPSNPTGFEYTIIGSLSTSVPLIVLPWMPNTSPHFNLNADELFPKPKLSQFCPRTPASLRAGLFHSPETLALLRFEAAERFLRWREVERSVDGIWREGLLSQRQSQNMGIGSSTLRNRRLTERRSRLGERANWTEEKLIRDADNGKEKGGHNNGWDKSKWEAEWMENLSRDVAIGLRGRSGTIMAMPPQGSNHKEGEIQELRASEDEDTKGEQILGTEKYENDVSLPLPDSGEDNSFPDLYSPLHHPFYIPFSSDRDRTAEAAFDPLHLPSLFYLSVSLLTPIRQRVGASLCNASKILAFGVRGALVGGFCVGVGVGVWVGRAYSASS